jgi:hypothetical protein
VDPVERADVIFGEEAGDDDFDLPGINRRVRRRLIDEMGVEQGLDAWSKYRNDQANNDRVAKNRAKNGKTRAKPLTAWNHPSLQWTEDAPVWRDATGAVVPSSTPDAVLVMKAARSSVRKVISENRSAERALTPQEFLLWQRERQSEGWTADGQTDSPPMSVPRWWWSQYEAWTADGQTDVDQPPEAVVQST